jgi:hypothetical protein
VVTKGGALNSKPILPKQKSYKIRRKTRIYKKRNYYLNSRHIDILLSKVTVKKESLRTAALKLNHHNK